jgi:hypothetical protein
LSHKAGITLASYGVVLRSDFLSTQGSVLRTKVEKDHCDRDRRTEPPSMEGETMGAPGWGGWQEVYESAELKILEM